MSKVVIIGGGAAGMAAAIGAAECGHDVSVYEKNEKLGKKIYITGKGRCNLTNGCDTEDLFKTHGLQRKIPLQCDLRVHEFRYRGSRGGKMAVR